MKPYLTLITLTLFGLIACIGLASAETAPPTPDTWSVADGGPPHAESETTQGNETVAGANAVLPAGDALPDTVGLVTRMGLSLLAVIALIWGTVQILKRFSSGSSTSGSSSRIRVLDRAYIAPKKSIYVVQIGEKALALGVSDHQMTTLTDLDLEETLAQYQSTQSTPVSQRFTDVYKAVNARFVRQTEEPAT